MVDRTVVYYTNNVEDQEFERKIRWALLDRIDEHELPLVSVSQKPLVNFGNNIVVGEVGSSRQNMFRQMLIGVQAAETEWVVTAEADVLLPPGYLSFNSLGRDMWMCSNCYVLRQSRPEWFSVGGHLDGLLLVKRAVMIQALEKRLKLTPGFGPGRARRPFQPWDCGELDMGIPVVLFKTARAMGPGGGWADLGEPVRELPFWGKAADLAERFLDVKVAA